MLQGVVCPVFFKCFSLRFCDSQSRKLSATTIWGCLFSCSVALLKRLKVARTRNNIKEAKTAFRTLWMLSRQAKSWPQCDHSRQWDSIVRILIFTCQKHCFAQWLCDQLFAFWRSVDCFYVCCTVFFPPFFYIASSAQVVSQTCTAWRQRRAERGGF